MALVADNMKEFTSYFGTAIHGADILWQTDKTAEEQKLYFTFTQNLFAKMYTFWKSGDADDSALFTGTYDYTNANDAIDNAALWFYLQFKNPTTGASPQYDALLYKVGVSAAAAVTTENNLTTGSEAYASTNLVFNTPAATIEDLAPDTDYEIESKLDSTVNSSASASRWNVS